MIYPWKLDYWQSGEWQVANEKLKDIEKTGGTFNPRRSDLFASLRLLQPGEVKVCIIGQDPYPDPAFATGIPFSIPSGIGPESFPRTLLNIFKEYVADLKYPLPTSGDLTGWVTQGVLLWNAIPTCRSGLSLSHDWPGEEWKPLTKEIVGILSGRGIVFCFLGSVAKRYLEYVDLTKNEVILTSHPSPRGTRFSKTPFEGSRLFSTINAKLISQGLDPIDWRLSDVPDQQDQSNKEVLGEPKRVWNSNRRLSWEQGKDARGVRDHGRLVVHERSFSLGDYRCTRENQTSLIKVGKKQLEKD